MNIWLFVRRTVQSRLRFSKALRLLGMLLLVLVVGCGKKEPPPETSAAVEKAFQLGGKIRIETRDYDLSTADDIPKGHYTLRQVNLAGTKTTDKDLTAFKDVKSLQRLNLYGTKITDAGLDHLAAMTFLQELELSNTAITDKGLAKLSTLTGLKKLYVNDTRVTKGAVDSLKQQLKNCTIFHIQ